MSNIYHSSHPLIAHKLSLLRDINTDPKLFRELISEISSLLAYEATQDSTLVDVKVQTPLSTTTTKQIKEKSGIVPILRAGLGMVESMLEFLPNASVLHIGLYRDEQTLQPVEYYNKLSKKCTVDRVFVVDPMLATGGSVSATIDILKKWGTKKIIPTSQSILLQLTRGSPQAKIRFLQDIYFPDLGTPEIGSLGHE